MSKPTKQDESIANGIVAELIDAYFRQEYHWEESDGVGIALRKIQKQHDNKRAALLAPPRPRKPASRQSETAVAPVPASGTVVPVPSGLQNTSDIRKRGNRK